MKDMLLALLIVVVFSVLFWFSVTICRKNHSSMGVLKEYRYAHRGYHNKPVIPENSLLAFRLAANRGWGAELDVHLMNDGSLAVIHDSSLKRTVGADVCIEDLSAKDLDSYFLEESRERIPLLQDVLSLFEGKAPLIIELKTKNNNHDALSAAVAAMLDVYQGDYCIESFDYRVVHWFRKNRPNVIRGQLSMDYFAVPHKMPKWKRIYRTYLWSNIFTKPDFVAYQFRDRESAGLALCQFFHHPVTVYWTLRNKKDLLKAEHDGAICIFEGFDPDL